MITPLSLNDNVIKVIKEMLPEDNSLFHFLSGILPLNKEAIYRRLRREVTFSFFEVYLIAQKLGVSLDYLVRSLAKEHVTFELVQQQFQDTKDNLTVPPDKFGQILGYILEDPFSKFELSHNLFPQVHSHMFYHLSKYNSFKWVYKNRSAKPTPFKEVEYPQSLYQMHKENGMATMNIKNTSYIWDYTIVEMLIRELKYFKNLGLLDNDDVAMLKEELYQYLQFIESLTVKGAFPTGNKVDIYVSSVNSDAAYSYIESSRFQISIIGVFDLQYVISTDSLAFDIMKKNIMSIKQGATLISGSSEIYRVPFFRKQYELVNDL